MLLLEAILVVLMLTIGHRQCSSIPHATTSTENKALSILPSSFIISTQDSDGCITKVFPKDLNGVLSLSCKKSCNDGKERLETEGNECIVTVTQTKSNEATITVGTCKNGTCVTKNPVECVPTSLTSTEEEDQQEDEEEEEEGE
uniref:Putative secreted protein n=1 Tax=Ixodes ricinus TaxID=34613 RepID=A0A090XCZ8_IXORI